MARCDARSTFRNSVDAEVSLRLSREDLYELAWSKPISIELQRLVARLGQEFQQSPGSHQVQCAYDHHGVVVLLEELLELRQPVLIASRHQRAVKGGEFAVFLR